MRYFDTDSFIVYIKTNDIYKDIEEDVETRLDTSSYELECNSIDILLPKRKKEKSNWINERWIRWKKLVGLRAKIYSYLIDGGGEDKKAAKKCVIKRKLKFENYKNWLEATQLDNKIKYLEIIKLAKIVLKKSWKIHKKQ